jgi:acyl-CoA thioesterase
VSFAADTAVKRIADRCFVAELDERWSSLVGIHGGYSAAVVVRAMEQAVNDPDRALRTFATQFAAAPRPGPVEIEVTVERAGRSMTTTSARLLQQGRLLQVAHAVSSVPWPGLAYDEHVRPRGADPGDAPIFVPHVGISHFQNAEVRLDPDVVPFGGGNTAWIAAWLRPLAGEAIDAAWLVAMCDMLPPAVFSRTTGPVKAASIEYVVHLATGAPHLPAGDHVYLSCHSPLSSEGFAVEDATMWGPDGRVLAVARQTRLAGDPAVEDGTRSVVAPRARD